VYGTGGSVNVAFEPEVFNVLKQEVLASRSVMGQYLQTKLSSLCFYTLVREKPCRSGDEGRLDFSDLESHREGLAGRVVMLTRRSVTGRYTRTYRWCRYIYALKKEETCRGGD
jgi:hypothetical protein